MKRTILGAALAAAVSLGAARDAGAQTLGDRIRRAESSRESTRERDRWENDRDIRNQRIGGRYDSRLYAVRLDEYLRGISLSRTQRHRVERAWDNRSSREQRLRAVRAQLSRAQQRRFDANVVQIERRYDRYDRRR